MNWKFLSLQEIQNSAQEEMGKMQREYLLREQIKAIQRELVKRVRAGNGKTNCGRKIEEAKLPERGSKEPNRELSRLEKLPTALRI